MSKTKKELLVFTICLILGTSLNMWSVFKYEGGLKELLSQAHIALLIGFAIYFLYLIFRFVFWILLSLFEIK